MWNTHPGQARGEWLTGVPDDWAPCLEDIGRSYLPYVNENIAAVKAGQKRFSPTVDGVTYPRARASAYRIWCLEQLRAEFESLPADAAATSRAVLERYGCWEPMWRVEELNSGVNEGVAVPFFCSDKMVI